ncbi:Hypothetical_protein [Hexamita inflata]|uniref:Hypothetical_protein n=1 Tax=Hexamita inflata TaxID=28002 RepID=A0AA86PAU6_9EUKA|nr:Hypothetical protein HINF_LOCUS20944 [Hexamita inflata]CAI9933305.1 Hypothetical protein HINF_LOCUS20950 [Hexamita inflata]
MTALGRNRAQHVKPCFQNIQIDGIQNTFQQNEPDAEQMQDLFRQIIESAGQVLYQIPYKLVRTSSSTYKWRSSFFSTTTRPKRSCPMRFGSRVQSYRRTQTTALRWSTYCSRSWFYHICLIWTTTTRVCAHQWIYNKNYLMISSYASICQRILLCYSSILMGSGK